MVDSYPHILRLPFRHARISMLWWAAEALNSTAPTPLILRRRVYSPVRGKPPNWLISCNTFGVMDGARTRDLRSHNPALYLLSYHHRKPAFRGHVGQLRCRDVLQPDRRDRHCWRSDLTVGSGFWWRRGDSNLRRPQYRGITPGLAQVWNIVCPLTIFRRPEGLSK